MSEIDDVADRPFQIGPNRCSSCGDDCRGEVCRECGETFCRRCMDGVLPGLCACCGENCGIEENSWNLVKYGV